MLRTPLCLCVIFGALLPGAVALADGEPTAEMSGTGIIVPVRSVYARVLDQRVSITLPRAKDVVPPKHMPNDWEDKPAVVRVEYLLQNAEQKPLNIQVGWPTSGFRMKARPRVSGWRLSKASTPAIKLDGKPIPFNLVGGQELEDTENRAITSAGIPRIEKFLDAEPKLKEQVLAIRRKAESQRRSGDWLEGVGADELKRWMVQQKMLPGGQNWTRSVALGLLGYTRNPYSSSNQPTPRYIQGALHWIDPGYEEVDVRRKLAERWGHREVLLNPSNGQLADISGNTMSGGTAFAVFRFPITLQPGKKHKLVIQYGSYLGWVGQSDPWYGMVYIMEPAKRWGPWEKTTIEVRVPPDWAEVAIRPPAKRVSASGGFQLYRIVMNQRPSEDLWISAIPRSYPKRR